MSNQASALPQALKNLVEAAERLNASAALLAQIADSNRHKDDVGWQPGVAKAPPSLALAAVGLTPGQRLICERVLNAFETGTAEGRYGAIAIFHDGPNDIRQITYGRSQTTEYGNLRELVQMYVDARGRFAEELREYLPRIGRTALVDDSRFKNLLKQAGNEDPIMRQTQDVFFDRRYFQPAIRWANENGFSLPLSALVIYDSFIHSGQIRPDLRRRFPEKTPSAGGDERVWIRQYVDVRHQWLLNHHRPAVRTSSYRTRDLAKEIARGNWNFTQLPIMAHGVPIDDRGADRGIVETSGYAVEPEELYALRLGEVEEEQEEVWCEEEPEFEGPAFVEGFGAAAAGDLASLATRILNHPNIGLATAHVSGVADQATVKHNIIDTAAGARAKRSNYKNAPGGTVALSDRMLGGLLALAEQNSFSISELCGGSHSSNSRHYAGVAADINRINGRPVRASHPDLATFKAKCRMLGATEVKGPGDTGHNTHVHAAWPRPV
jgi:chitosanase